MANKYQLETIPVWDGIKSQSECFICDLMQQAEKFHRPVICFVGTLGAYPGADAEERGVQSGDRVHVKTPAGEIEIEALVTSRIVPGTIGIPQGAWHKADMDGDRVDVGGCVNTLTTYRPTPLAKGNGPAHSMIAQVTKA